MSTIQDPVPADRLIVSIEQRREAVLDVIRQARHCITLSLFRCNDDQVFAELAAAVRRGVAVEALVTSRAKGGKKKLAKLWSTLERTGAAVKPYTDPVVKYHAKYLVADDGPALVASLNFTKKCFRTTCDAIVVTHDPAVVSSLQRLMAADAARERMPDDLSDRLLVGPERARRQFTALIAQARSSIRLIDAKLSDPDIVTLLKARRSEGVTVEVFDWKRLGEWKSHGKILLIDDARLVVGSTALAAMSLDFRREVAIVVDEASAVAEAVELFRTLRAAAAEAGTIPAGAVDGVSW
jgi:cardiolipin synthase